MSDTVIKVENLSKKYIIRHQQAQQYTALRDVIADGVKSIGRRLSGAKQDSAMGSTQEEFWALKDVSFEVKQGDRIGIIGRNGAGKSTLLKILSRITEPTTGQITLNGRVASLLEVGTGFHPELTGRENIYLNGAILGMDRVDIKRKFDEIVDFAEIEKFLDTPVKRYSSGMYVRLAFAVAAYLEPDILIVDEVLAVGDSQFQKKCLGKMEDIAEKEERTVLFVSHNMGAITQLCNQAILLIKGEVNFIEQPEKVISQYINSNTIDGGFVDLKTNKERRGNKKVLFRWVKSSKNDGQETESFSIGDDVCISFCIESSTIVKNIKLSLEIRTSEGIKLSNSIDMDSGFQIEKVDGLQSYCICFRDIRLYPDAYYISLWASSTDSIEPYDYIEDCLRFQIVDGGKLTMRYLPRSAGIFFFTPEWYQI
jgi:lipopolysaccharide transport system ATP-binding protein